MSTTEHFKDGAVTHSHSDEMVTMAERWLLEYFRAFGPKRPGDFEDDFCGEPGLTESMMSPLGRWAETPFYIALTRLVDKGQVRWWRDSDNIIWYAVVEVRNG